MAMPSKGSMLVGAVGLMLAGGSHAADLSLSGGVGGWDQGLSGEFSDAGNRSFDLEDDAGLDDTSNVYVWAQLEHPIFLLPNIRLEHTRFDTDGNGTVERNFTFRGENFQVREDVSSEFELNQTDIIGYYSIWDTLVDLDLGLDVRLVDGDVAIQSQRTGRTASESFTAPVPMAYAAARFDVPGTGAWIRAQGSGVGFDGNSYLDARATMGYTFGFGGGVELGYRRQDLEIDDVDDVDGDLEIDGAFAGVYYAF